MNSFDERASTWDDDPAKLEQAQFVAAAVRDVAALDGTQRLFEYGAGTALVSQALLGSVGSVTLVDTSAGMREVMLAKIAAGAIPGARVWDLDLQSAPAPDEQFDVVVTVLTMHHVQDVGAVLSRFAELLADGGRLCIVDLEAEDGSFHGPGADVHHGFERAELADALTAAGFADVTFQACHQIDRGGSSYPMFLAASVRPARVTAAAAATT